MKINNWCKKLSATLVASGLLMPSAVQATDIPLVDPSFEAYDVSTHNGGFAYAAAGGGGGAYTGAYRPTSAWIDDPNLGGQDDVFSNWIYNQTYGEPNRGTPRTGDQAMHGRGHYSGQVVTDVYEAGKTYTFSVWAQGDSDSFLNSTYGWDSRVWLYLYDGSAPFSEPTSLVFDRHSPPDQLGVGDFFNRTVGSTPTESIATWQQISISHYVLPGAPEVGNPIGVAFWAGIDAGVDDAKLEVVDEIPLDLRVDRDNGSLLLSNNSNNPIHLSGYSITSAFGSLDFDGWLSISNNYDSDNGGGPTQADPNNSWSELSPSGSHGDLSEADLDSGLGATLAPGKTINLSSGGGWIATPVEDLKLSYVSNGQVVTGLVHFEDNGGESYEPGDFDTNGTINALDWGILRDNQHANLSGFSLAEAYRHGDMTGDGLNNHADFAAFKATYETLNGLGSFAALLAGVPEPSTIVLSLASGVFLLAFRRREDHSPETAAVREDV